MSVGIVKGNCFTIFYEQILVVSSRESLPKSGAIFKSKSCCGESVAHLSPGIAAGTFMALINKYKIVALKSFYRYSNTSTSLFFYEFGYFSNLHLASHLE